MLQYLSVTACACTVLVNKKSGSTVRYKADGFQMGTGYKRTGHRHAKKTDKNIRRFHRRNCRSNFFHHKRAQNKQIAKCKQDAVCGHPAVCCVLRSCRSDLQTEQTLPQGTSCCVEHCACRSNVAVREHVCFALDKHKLNERKLPAATTFVHCDRLDGRCGCGVPSAPVAAKRNNRFSHTVYIE